MDITTNLIKGKEISVEDLIYLRQLLETDLPLSFSFELLKNRNNEAIFQKIEEELSKGKMVEDVIEPYLPRKIKSYMLPLLKHFPFIDSLALSLDFNDKTNSSSNSLFANISYPCILLFVTISALYLFDLYGMDSIFSLLSSFGGNLGLYNSIRIMFRVFIRAFYYGILFLILILIYFLSPKRITILYIFMSRYLPSSLFSIYYSEEFVSLLLICVKRGYGFKKSLEVLKKMKGNPVISLLAFHLDESLLEGEELKDAVKNRYYDLSLSRFIKIANYANDFEGVLESYTRLARERIKQKMKLYSRTIQIITYLIIGIIIIFIYQILFMPMQALTQF